MITNGILYTYKRERYRTMQTIQIKISNNDFKKYNFENKDIKFTDLVDLIGREYAKKALLDSQKIAKKVGLSKMTLDEIQEEVRATRNETYS